MIRYDAIVEYRAGVCLFGLSCVLFALECTVLNLYKNQPMPRYYMPLGFVTAFLAMAGAIVKISNSNKSPLISKKNEIILALITVLNSTSLVCMNSYILLSEEEQNEAAVYLTMEMIIAGSLVMLILPFFCTEHQPEYSRAQAAAENQIENSTDRRSENIVIDDCPPKYDDLFPQRP
ncbi:Oidioi.mRNA.OKI2018_I69.PAR.g8542.t2.cds [Oikopleura dioica]|uniref:Oidioi.mRNA.OKI2018_I69.PAR.g8542.t2.cds n=1 Tax=Oikopleura dioica TaxID=34765 RepID=A0ABN7RGG7_OIKDI|nr:Oidioi.mRNA.OKI2018_I69.PAR.g8542.t2.cds [Oikopleura dioica]